MATTQTDDYFVPELCRADAVLSLIILAELMVLVLTLAQPIEGDWDWVHFGLISLFVQWNVLLSAALLCLLRPWLRQFSPLLTSLISCALVCALTLVCTAIADEIRLVVAGREPEYLRYMRHGLISLIFSGLALHYFYLQSEQRRQERAESMARLQALQARIRPHFLFNSLNSIASLIAIDAAKAEQAVLDLSDLFRASLSQSEALSTWQAERLLGERYLAIEHYRLGNRLQVNWNISARVPSDLPLPAFTLQPLLENAVIHGIQPLTTGGAISIKADYTKGVFNLEMTNPVAAVAARGESGGTREAQKNIRARIVALFGTRATLTVEQKGGLYILRLRFPYERHSRKPDE